MTLPREVIPGRFYMVTRRCTQRLFLLRPDEETNNAFLLNAMARSHCSRSGSISSWRSARTPGADGGRTCGRASRSASSTSSSPPT